MMGESSSSSSIAQDDTKSGDFQKGTFSMKRNEKVDFSGDAFTGGGGGVFAIGLSHHKITKKTLARAFT